MIIKVERHSVQVISITHLCNSVRIWKSCFLLKWHTTHTHIHTYTYTHTTHTHTYVPLITGELTNMWQDLQNVSVDTIQSHKWVLPPSQSVQATWDHNRRGRETQTKMQWFPCTDIQVLLLIENKWTVIILKKTEVQKAYQRLHFWNNVHSNYLNLCTIVILHTRLFQRNPTHLLLKGCGSFIQLLSVMTILVTVDIAIYVGLPFLPRLVSAQQCGMIAVVLESQIFSICCRYCRLRDRIHQVP